VKVSRLSDSVAQPGDPATFSGSVRRQDLIETDAPRSAVVVVTFDAGARTHWHSHADGQLIYVLEGEGRVQSQGEPAAIIRPGDLVHVPPGELHWHGAAPHAAMAHLACSFGATDWHGEVDRQTYEHDVG
jgi:quercetin dioxygenase-like cupin family protein